MSKVNSHSLLLMTLVFSTAHAPTFHFWRHAAPRDPQNAATIEAPQAALPGPGLSAAVLREFAEDDDIHRFQLDELYLPNLDVSLPALFEWSDLDRAYLADLGPAVDTFGLTHDSPTTAALHVASVVGDDLFANARRGGMVGISASLAGASGSSQRIDSMPAATKSQVGKGDSDAASDTGSNDGTAPNSGTDSSDDSQFERRYGVGRRYGFESGFGAR